MIVHSRHRALMENERGYAKVTHRLENVEVQLRTGMIELLSKNVMKMDLVQVWSVFMFMLLLYYFL